MGSLVEHARRELEILGEDEGNYRRACRRSSGFC